MNEIDLNLIVQNGVAVGLAVWVIREGMAVNREMFNVLVKLVDKLMEICDERASPNE